MKSKIDIDALIEAYAHGNSLYLLKKVFNISQSQISHLIKHNHNRELIKTERKQMIKLNIKH